MHLPKRSITALCALAAGLVAVPVAAHAGTAGYSPAAATTHGGLQLVSLAGSSPSWANATSRVGDVGGQARRTIQVALGLRDPQGAQEAAVAVNTPGSPRYREFLSSSEFTERFGPTREAVRRVSGWLRAQGVTVTDVAANRHFVEATGSVADLEKAFRVTLSRYNSRVADAPLVAPDREIRLPRHLRPVVTAVLGLDDSTRAVPQHQPLRPTAQQQPGGGCARYWAEQNHPGVPQKYPAGRQSNALCGYNAGQTRNIHQLSARNTGAGQRVGIVGAYHLDSIVTDTNRAAVTYGATPLTPGQYRAVKPSKFTDHPDCPTDRDSWYLEQAMDVQAVHTMAPRASITYYAAKNCTHLDATLNKAVADNKVGVISNSWGALGESTVPPAAHRQFGAIVVQAAAQGQTVLFSSGDTGDQSGVNGNREPNYPASHPWITAVGGTTVAVGADNRQKWVSGWENTGNTLANGKWVPQKDKDGPFAGGAGGGRSRMFAEPDYQKKVVPDTIARGKRAVPDISALADSYTGFGLGYTSYGDYVEGAGGGTSLASPLLGGMVADAAQIRGGRLGFLNAAFYRMAGDRAIADVTPVRAGIATPQMSAFGGVHVPTKRGVYLIDVDAKPQTLQSRRGWDTVTGLGTPTSGFVTRLGK